LKNRLIDKGTSQNAQSTEQTGTAALAALAISGAAQAQQCSTKMLNGMYSVSFHGERLGLLTGSPPTLTPFATPNLVDGIEVFTFDGEGTFTNLNFALRDGVPNSLGQPGLTPDGFATQTGPYHVNDDCTGAGTMSQPGLSFTFALVVSDRGRKIRYVGTSTHADTIPGNPNCTSGCYVAVEGAAEGEKVFGR
jgi:hypothetical protein